MKDKVFLDTAYAIALSVETDSSHERALELADEIRAKVSDYIVERAQIEFARDRGDII